MDKKAGIAGLVERFADLPDARVEGRTDPRSAGHCGPGALRRYLRPRNGIPGHDTIRRVFEALSPMELALRFEAWMGEVCPAVQGRVIAIDGKACGDRRELSAVCGPCIRSRPMRPNTG